MTAAAVVLAAIGGSYVYWVHFTVEGRACTALAAAEWPKLREQNRRHRRDRA